MLSFKRKYISIILVICSLSIYSQNIQLNEVMTKNTNSFTTSEGYTYDWIEIYNSSSDTLQLSNYFLSKDIEDLYKWQFPNIEIFPDSFLVVFASKNYTTDINCGFKLKSKGVNIYLSKLGNQIIDSLIVPSLKPNSCFGRIEENSNELNFLDIPTPKYSNAISNHLFFSMNSGFYSNSFQLKINSLKQNHTIYYTLNGTKPNNSSFIFKDSMFIENRSSLENTISNIRTSPIEKIYHHNWIQAEEKINKITSIKFISYLNNEPSSKIYTKNFLLELPKTALPSICLVVDSTLLFDDDIGIYVPGNLYNSDYPNFTGNYFRNNKIPANFSFFDENKNLLLNQNIDIRIKGKTTRASAQKSLKLYAKKKYGEKYFNIPLLENDLSQYKRFILRTIQGSYNNNVISDDLANLIVTDLNIDKSETRFCKLYLNGTYWGVNSLRNELDEYYFSEKEGLEKSDISIANIDFESEIGDNSSLLLLREYIENNNLKEQNHYNFVSNILDIESYIDYQISQMFLNNLDWLGNNSKLWKSNKQNSKWRFVFYDLDATFTDIDKNMFSYCTATNSSEWRNAPKYTLLFRSLLKNENFKNKFIKRYLELLETSFSYGNTLKSFNEILKNINPEINENIERWHSPSSQTDWLSHLNNSLVGFLKERPCIVKHQLKDFFKLEIEVECDNINDKTIEFNLFPNPNNGSFFINVLSENVSIIIYYQIFSIDGSIVANSYSVLNENNYYPITSILPKGIYYIKIINANVFGVEKLIIN